MSKAETFENSFSSTDVRHAHRIFTDKLAESVVSGVAFQPHPERVMIGTNDDFIACDGFNTPRMLITEKSQSVSGKDKRGREEHAYDWQQLVIDIEKNTLYYSAGRFEMQDREVEVEVADEATGAKKIVKRTTRVQGLVLKTKGILEGEDAILGAKEVIKELARRSNPR